MAYTELTKAPPHDLNAEQALLGSMILDPEYASYAKSIDESIFYRTAHLEIFNAIKTLLNAEIKIDMITLADELSKKKVLENIGGMEYLNDLTTAGIITTNFTHYRRIIEEYARKRVIINTAAEAIEQAYDKDIRHEEVTNILKKGIDKSEGYTTETSYRHIKDLCLDTYEIFENDFNTEGIPGMNTGYKSIDEMFRMDRKKVILIGATPGMGKTTFAVNLVKNMSKQYSIAIKSLEQPATTLTEKMILSEASVKASYLRTKKENMKEHHWKKITMSINVLGRNNIHISDKSNQNVLEIREELSKLKKEKGLDVVLIDYLQLITPHTSGQTTDKIEDVTRELVSIAKDLDVLMIIISSLKRGIDERANKRPILSDLKGSGILEFSADGVFFIYRDSYYNEPEGERNLKGGDETEVIIAKNKEGSTGIAKMAYYKEENLIIDYRM